MAMDLVCVKSFNPFDGTSVTAVDVTAVAKSPTSIAAESRCQWVMALGSERGDMRVYLVNGGSLMESATLLLAVPTHHSHGATVRRLRWRAPRFDHLEWASCGEDRTLRVHRMTIQSSAVELN